MSRQRGIGCPPASLAWLLAGLVGGPLACTPDQPRDQPAPRPATPSIFEAQLYADDVVLDTLPLSISLETLGGVCVVLLPQGSALPVERTETFSTASDGQAAIVIDLVQGQNLLAPENRAIGKVELAGIPPAPRGEPRIDARFAVDVHGRLTVSSSQPVVLTSEPPKPVTAAELPGLLAPAPAQNQ